MAYIEKEPIMEFITKGLNNPDKKKAYGHDAIEILTEIEFAPIEKIFIERNKKIDSLVLGEIIEIAKENGLEKHITLNEKAIVSALKKQIPKRYELWNGQCSCPNCNKLFGSYSQLKTLIHWEMPYCKFCGQALDWGNLSELPTD